MKRGLFAAFASSIVSIFALHASIAQGATIYYVDKDATGSGDGLSWANAFVTFRDALTTPTFGDQVWVAEGAYYPDEGEGAEDNDRDSTFLLAPGVMYFGGFEGTETVLDQRDPLARPTILSGDIGGDDWANPALEAGQIVGENAYTVVTALACPPQTVLDGFVISGGQSDADSEGTNTWGGGLFIDYFGPTIRNCRIQGNFARNGGGAYIAWSTAPRFRDCQFIGNKANRGAGVFSSFGASPTFAFCDFAGNDASLIVDAPIPTAGGGAKGGALQPPEANFGQEGGGIYGEGWFSASGKRAAGSLGSEDANGFAIEGEGISHCGFYGNKAPNAGSAIAVSMADMLPIANSVFSGNQCAMEETAYGAIYAYNAPLAISDCTMAYNQAGGGGGIYLKGEPAMPTRNEINFFMPVSQISNTILWGNLSAEGATEAAQIATSYTLPLAGFIEEPLQAALNYSIVQGLSGALPRVHYGEGNLGDDPLLFDPDGPDNLLGTLDDDLNLTCGSPAIDAGLNERIALDHADIDEDLDIFEPIAWDFSRQPRVVAIDGPATGTVDIGAQETDVVNVLADGDPAEEGSVPGWFHLSREGDPIGDLPVHFQVSGSATFGEDYTGSGAVSFDGTNGMAVIPNGQSGISLDITPIDDLWDDDDETIALAIANGPGHCPGAAPTASLTILDNDGPPEIEIVPLSLDFGIQSVVDGPTAPQAVTIGNIGVSNLALDAVYIAGGAARGFNGAGPFLIYSDSGENPLPPGGLRVVEIVFDPNEPGPAAGALLVESSDADEPMRDVPLSGTATAPALQIDPASLDFGDQDIDDGPKGPLSLTISNAGDATLSFVAPGIQLGGDTSFAIVNSPSTAPLDPGASVDVQIAFDPATIGTKAGWLSVLTNDPNHADASAPLAGAGVQYRGAPIIQEAVDNLDGTQSFRWIDPNETPWSHVVLAYDIYEDMYLTWPSTQSVYFYVAPLETTVTLPLALSGGYHVWTSNLYPDLEWHVSLPWTGIMYSGQQHPVRDAALANLGANQVRLTWAPDLYGAWHYQIVVYKEGAGFVSVVDGPSKFLPIDPWTFIDYGQNPVAYDTAKANFYQGWANFTLPGSGNYIFFIRSVGWLPPYNASPWATPAITVP